MTPFHVLHRHRRPAARLALLAMLLLVLGPLIGQLSAAERHHHAGHAMDMAKPGVMAMAVEADATASSSTHHWHPACGYCTLFQQMPVLSAMLPSVPPLAAQAITAPVVATRAAHGGPAVFPQAPTRAPPLRRS
ncbi:DUF2946 domain-containing protein [Halomonas organivorans]|uniref:DUF2946 domain-containing protein n=1 Tax=Halomonas organivorans TaxID=257772 RepID=A0A7W5BZ98_9GAMM|nr:DUF2946 domain-containing protein [Halomonas organivorans]MBB3141912.1 hypothetical protein [Halomonas organivorans]